MMRNCSSALAPASDAVRQASASTATDIARGNQDVVSRSDTRCRCESMDSASIDAERKILGVYLLICAVESDAGDRRVEPLAKRTIPLADGDSDVAVEINRRADEDEVTALGRIGERPHLQR